MKSIKIKEFIVPIDYDAKVDSMKKRANSPYFKFNQLIINILCVLLCQQIL